MENIKMSEEQEKELNEVSAEFWKKEKAILEKWRVDNPNIKRGICNTSEMKAFRKEKKEKYFAIVEKYKNKNTK